MINFETISIVVIVASMSFILQIWPRLKNRYFGIDTWRFLLLADYIRQHKKFPDVIRNAYIIETPMDNPPLLPLILSFFKKKWMDRNQGFVSPVFDIITNISVFIISFLLTKDYVTSFLAQIIYSLTTVVTLEASNLSLRTLSNLIFSWTVVFSIFYAQIEIWPYFILAVLFLVLLSYTHRMSVQVLFFLFIGLTIWSRDVTYLVIFFVGIFLSVFLFNGYYLRFLRGHLLMISFWMYNIQNRLAHQIRGNPSRKNKHVDFVRRVEYLIWKIPVLPLLGPNLWNILVFIFTGLYFLDHDFLMPFPNLIFTAFMQWSIILFIAAIIFNLKHLRFLGEGQRYLEYATVPSAIVSASLLRSAWLNKNTSMLAVWIIFVGVGIGLVSLILIIFFQRKLVLDNPDKSVTQDLWNVIDYLNAQKEQVRIACIPYGLSDALAYFLKNKRVLLSDNSVGVWELRDFWPLIKRPLQEIADKYNLNFFLVSSNYVGVDEIKIVTFKKVFEKGPYVLLRRG